MLSLEFFGKFSVKNQLRTTAVLLIFSTSAAGQTPVVSSVRQISEDVNLVTSEGRDIVVLRVPATRDEQPIVPKYRFYIQGGLHGDELLTSEFVAWLAERTAKGKSILNNIPRQEAAFDFVPHANPDGSAKQSRYNSKLINLNRNFGILWGLSREAKGADKFSENETKAINFLLATQKYTAAVDVHGFINWIVAPSAPELVKQEQSIYARSYRQWLASLKKEMSNLVGYQLRTAGGLGDGGAFEDWAFWEHGTFAYCFELKSRQRFGPEPELTTSTAEVDRFKIYERFIYRMFRAAMDASSTSVALSERP